MVAESEPPSLAEAGGGEAPRVIVPGTPSRPASETREDQPAKEAAAPQSSRPSPGSSRAVAAERHARVWGARRDDETEDAAAEEEAAEEAAEGWAATQQQSPQPALDDDDDDGDASQ